MSSSILLVKRVILQPQATLNIIENDNAYFGKRVGYLLTLFLKIARPSGGEG